MVSVERMREYVDLEPEEKPNAKENEITHLPYVKLPSDWPTKGEIIFENVCLRYPEERKWALWKINLLIKPGTKVYFQYGSLLHFPITFKVFRLSTCPYLSR